LLGSFPGEAALFGEVGLIEWVAWLEREKYGGVADDSRGNDRA